MVLALRAPAALAALLFAACAAALPLSDTDTTPATSAPTNAATCSVSGMDASWYGPSGSVPDVSGLGLKPHELQRCSVRVLEVNGSLRQDLFSCSCPSGTTCLEQREFRTLSTSNSNPNSTSNADPNTDSGEGNSTSSDSDNGLSEDRVIVEHGACVTSSVSYCGASMWPQLQFWQNFVIENISIASLVTSGYGSLCSLSYAQTNLGSLPSSSKHLASCSCTGVLSCEHETFTHNVEILPGLTKTMYVVVGHCNESDSLTTWLMMFLPFMLAIFIFIFGYIARIFCDTYCASQRQRDEFCSNYFSWMNTGPSGRRRGNVEDQGFELLGEACSRRRERRRGGRSSDRVGSSRSGRTGADVELLRDRDAYLDDDEAAYSDDEANLARDRARRAARAPLPNKQPDLEVPLTVRYDE